MDGAYERNVLGHDYLHVDKQSTRLGLNVEINPNDKNKALIYSREIPSEHWFLTVPQKGPKIGEALIKVFDEMESTEKGVDIDTAIEKVRKEIYENR